MYDMVFCRSCAVEDRTPNAIWVNSCRDSLAWTTMWVLAHQDVDGTTFCMRLWPQDDDNLLWLPPDCRAVGLAWHGPLSWKAKNGLYILGRDTKAALTRATYETAVELLTPATTMGKDQDEGGWTWATRWNLNQTIARSGSKNLRKITEKFT